MPKKDILGRGDFWTILALLVGVILVIVVLPLWMKVAVLIAVCGGFFYLVQRSKWTHRWAIKSKLLTSGAIAGILCVIAIPQFISQWRMEHSASRQSNTAPRATLDNVNISYFGSTGVANSAGQLNLKDSSITGEEVGLDNQNPDAQINMDHSHIEGKVGMINRGRQNKQKQEPSH